METRKAELGVNVGKFAPDGSIEVNITHCPFTGMQIVGLHSNRERVADTPYFYRLDANSLHLVTEAWREQFAEQVRGLEQPHSVEAFKAERVSRKSDRVEAKDEGE